MLDAPPRVACTECARCCTYVAVAINAPSRPRFATDILWYLYHEGVSVYRDGNGEWFVQFAARCRNLQPDLLCGVYGQRPHVCRGFDDATCEVNDPEGGLTLETPEAFLAWLGAEQPRLLERIFPAFVPPRLAAGLPGGASRGAGSTQG